MSIDPYSVTFVDIEVLRRARLLIGASYNPLTWFGERAFAHDLQHRSLGILLMAFLLMVRGFNVL